jgi:hypothetical protein
MNARAALAVAALALAWACAGTHGGDDPDPEPKAKVYKVPLKSVYVSFEQEGTKHFDRGSKEDPDGELRAIWKVELGEEREFFLVRACKVGGAAKAARKVLSGQHKGGAPASADDGAAEYWLVAYLGTLGSEPPAFSVVSAERQGRTISLRVQKIKRTLVSKDRHQYLVWVPLGKLPNGKYTLELYLDGEKTGGGREAVLVREKAGGLVDGAAARGYDATTQRSANDGQGHRASLAGGPRSRRSRADRHVHHFVLTEATCKPR